MVTTLATYCRHMSQSGAEGPVAALGRFPVLWVCDRCGALEVSP